MASRVSDIRKQLFASKVSKPKYVKIQNSILENIDNGTWSPGDRIPTEKALSGFFQASVGTVRHAVQGLVEQGYLVREQGRGTFVSSYTEHRDSLRYYRFAEYLGSKINALSIRCLARPQLVMAGEAAKALHLEPESEFYRLERIFSLESNPVVYATSYLPRVMFEGFDQIPLITHEETTLYVLVEQQFNLPTLGTRESFSAVSASAEVAGHLDMEPGQPVLKIVMLAATTRNVPYEYRISYCRTANLSLIRENAAMGSGSSLKFFSNT